MRVIEGGVEFYGAVSKRSSRGFFGSSRFCSCSARRSVTILMLMTFIDVDGDIRPLRTVLLSACSDNVRNINFSCCRRIFYLMVYSYRPDLDGVKNCQTTFDIQVKLYQKSLRVQLVYNSN